MRKKKIYFNYWQLPDWDKAKIFIAHIFMHNGKEYLLVRDGDDDYSIKRPKQKGWDEVKKADTIIVTKIKNTEKCARLLIE